MSIDRKRIRTIKWALLGATLLILAAEAFWEAIFPPQDPLLRAALSKPDYYQAVLSLLLCVVYILGFPYVVAKAAGRSKLIRGKAAIVVGLVIILAYFFLTGLIRFVVLSDEDIMPLSGAKYWLTGAVYVLALLTALAQYLQFSLDLDKRQREDGL